MNAVTSAGAGTAARYGVAAAAVAAALAIKLALVPWVEHDTPFLLFFAAVLVAGWYGGLGPGLCATSLAALGSAYFFMAPYHDVRVHDAPQRVRLALFAAEGVFISALTAFLQSARRRADAAVAETMRLERRILEASEQARRDVGHDLHDGLGQQLAGAALRLNRLARRLGAAGHPDAPDARAVEELLRRSVAWTRDLAAGLSPVGLRHDGLPAALEELAGRTQSTFDVRCTFHGEPSADGVDAEDALHLYLIAQEAAGSAARLRSPTLIRLALSATPDTIILTVEDDGDTAARRDGVRADDHGVVLDTLCHRARIIGARLEAQRLAPRGTAVTCFYPRRHPGAGVKP
jgi:signal transduction histidine kinase